jgi:hypothetical protein
MAYVMPRERRARFSATMIRVVSPMAADCAVNVAVWRRHRGYRYAIPDFGVLILGIGWASFGPMHTNAASAATLLWTCVALFAALVVGQVETLLVAPAWLPDMEAWRSKVLPYPVLLPAQIGTLMLMAVVAWNRRVRNGSFARSHPRATQALRILAGILFFVMAIRLAVNVQENGLDFWREGAIPVAFHWVLALFVLVSGRASVVMGGVRVPAQHRHQHEETDDIAYGDIPAMPKPLAYGFGLGKQVGHGDAG